MLNHDAGVTDIEEYEKQSYGKRGLNKYLTLSMIIDIIINLL